MAKSVNLSTNYLNEKVKRVTGVNFVDYVSQMRIAKARDLLRDRNLRVSEVAFAVGYSIIVAVQSRFQKFTRKSPTQFRITSSRC
ncbi:MAG: hypothetical protein DMF14_00260 [Verrucomicrobia bacterium]|nr:MAG: hypothetical protein DME40_15720 [Verrucomicrobiota bacterium]PYL93719.1 MAG: hypothetical protein DMF14_00260 [Verrucomicrobiota bacterium]